MSLSAMSGLEPLPVMADGRLPCPAMAETISMRMTAISRRHVAEARLLQPSRPLGVSEGSVKDADGTLLAHATCTAAILATRP
jgi:hypothetical protein